ncbi:MAG: hypothetical protein CL910_09350 [Deltaproteobacteria bacterium]|nr:hypothetical protein [Deltaproteobacteria bacterium]
MIPETSLASSIITCVLFAAMVVVFYMVRPVEERKFLLPLAMIAFVIKAALVPLYFQFLVSIGFDGFAFFDSVKYHLASVKMSTDIAYDRPWDGYGWTFNDPGYGFIGAILYWIFGPNVLIPRFLNVAVSSMTLLYVYRVARMTFDERAARVAAILVAFIPFTLLHTINHRKEPFVQFLAMFIFFHAFCIFRQNKNLIVHVFFLVIALVGMRYFRNGFVLPFLAVMVVSFLISQRNLLLGFGLAGITVIAVIGFQVMVAGDPDASVAADVGRLQGKLARSASFSEVGGLLRYARMSSLTEIYKLPLALFLFIIMPFPPFFREEIPTILLSWANLFGVALLPHTIRGAWSLLRRSDWRAYLPVLIFPAVFLLLFSVIHVGLLRYRETISPMLMIFAAGGWVLPRNALLSGIIYGGLAALAVLVYTARFA